MHIFKGLGNWVLVFLFVFTVESCDEGVFGDPVVISNVEKEFYFDIEEELVGENRFVHFLVETIAHGDCLNGVIAYDFLMTKDKLTLALEDVVIPEDCIIGVAPAVADVYVGSLEKDFYRFELSLRSTVVNRGHLSISAKKYRVYLETEEGVIMLHNTLYRIPENTFWGYISYENVADEAVAMDMLLDLESIGELPSLDKGYYGYFDINTSSDGIEVKDSPQSSYLKPFIFSYNGNWASVKNIADLFLTSHPEVTLKLYGDKGEIF